MEQKFLDRIQEDYKLVAGNWSERQCDHSDEVASYFGDMDSSDRYYTIADSHGEIALNELTEFVSNVFFPIDGSWLGIKGKADASKKDIEEINMVRRVINEELINRRFYSYISDLIRHGYMYRNSVLNVSDIGGLNFDIVRNRDISLSYEKGEAGKRAYIETTYTVMELLENFEGEHIEQMRSDYISEGEPKQDQLMACKTVVACIIPRSKFFGTTEYKKYKYVKLYMLLDGGDYHFVTNKEEGITGFHSFPLLNYYYQSKRSLAEIALPYVLNANRYEMQKSERAEIENNPTLVLDKRTLAANQFSTGVKGMIGTSADEVQPNVLQTTGSSSITRDDIQDAHAAIDRIFKTDIVRRTQITAISNFEQAEYMMKAIEATALACHDIVNVANDAMKRICDILSKTHEDTDKKRLIRKYKSSTYSVGLQNSLERCKRILGTGRFLQSAVPLIQARPSAAQMLSADRALLSLAADMGVTHLIASEEEVNAERQAAAQQAQAQQAQQQQETDAKTMSAQKGMENANA